MNTLSSTSIVAFGGSRNLPTSFSPLVSAVVLRGAAAHCAALRVGCASGADAMVIDVVASAARGLPDWSAFWTLRAQIFAAFGPRGQGNAGQVSNVAGVRAALAMGVSVAFWAGGDADLPIAARLARRSAMVVSGCDTGIYFLFSPALGGSLKAAAVAARGGSAVYAFACGFAGQPAKLPGMVGSWVDSSFAELPCWEWLSGQPTLF